MTDLSALLHARIAEQKAQAENKQDDAPIHETGCYYYDHTLDSAWFCDCNGPAAALREVSAKQAVIAVTTDPMVLSALALAYAAHPDYRTDWDNSP